jgi:ABC-type ATPase with predicted acetyltransferase domain
MATYSICKGFERKGEITDRMAQVCRMFGLTTDRLSRMVTVHECRLEINDGDIVYITGPSGAGKSVLLRELEKAVPAGNRINLASIELPADKTLIDCLDGDVLSAMRTLSTAGLNDVFCILNRPAYLSDGQKYRFRLATALATKKKFIFADEYCSELDRLTAAVVSYNIHKFSKQTDTTFILASSHDDILLDLAPDVLVVKDFTGPAEVIYKNRRS